jgi:hypothetical protein
VLAGLLVALELRPIGSPETSIINYLSTLRTTSKERRFLLHHRGSLKSRTKFYFSIKQISWFILLRKRHNLHTYRSFATTQSWHFWVIGAERNVCRCTFNRYSVITQFAKLAAGERLCHRCTHRKL